MLRQKESLTKDSDADYFDEEAFEHTIKEIKNFILDRIKEINERADTQLRDDLPEVEEEMNEFISFWQNAVDAAHEESESPLSFGRRYMVTPPTGGARRLFKQYNSSGKDDAIETLTSMRNVDTSVNGSVIIWED